MTEMEAILARHSVREYLERPIEGDIFAALQGEMALCNEESGLRIQLVTNEPEAFSGFMARYGRFRGVSNYFALVGKNGSRQGASLDERCGYYYLCFWGSGWC